MCLTCPLQSLSLALNPRPRTIRGCAWMLPPRDVNTLSVVGRTVSCIINTCLFLIPFQPAPPFSPHPTPEKYTDFCVWLCRSCAPRLIFKRDIDWSLIPRGYRCTRRCMPYPHSDKTAPFVLLHSCPPMPTRTISLAIVTLRFDIL